MSDPFNYNYTPIPYPKRLYRNDVSDSVVVADEVEHQDASARGYGSFYDLPDMKGAKDPLDHDHDGAKGGAVEVNDQVAKLRADLDALGVSYDKRWREARLTQALDEATKA